MGTKEYRRIIMRKLDLFYKNRFVCRVTDSNEKIQYALEKESFTKYDFALSINIKYQVAILWDLRYHKKAGATAMTLSLKERWDHLLLEEEIYEVYKNLKVAEGYSEERILVFSLDFLERNLEYIFSLSSYHENKLSKEKHLGEETLVNSRTKSLVSRLNRDAKFRKKVLALYNYQCAICRAEAPEILEAAHIQAVYSGGLDNPENGICLCANHHLMYDRGLITIDFSTHTLSYVSSCVKNMAWYTVFIEMYQGKILVPKKKEKGKRENDHTGICA